MISNLLALLLAFSSSQIPEPTGKCAVDLAGVISDSQLSTLNSMCMELHKSKDGQIVFLTVPTLGGLDIKDYSMGVATKWKLGFSGKEGTINSSGLLLLVSPFEKKFRVEIGYGLEGALPDGKAMALFRSLAGPYFKQQQYGLGLIELGKEYIRIVHQEASAHRPAPVATPTPIVQTTSTRTTTTVSTTHEDSSFGILLFFCFFIGLFLLGYLFLYLAGRSTKKKIRARYPVDLVDRQETTYRPPTNTTRVRQVPVVVVEQTPASPNIIVVAPTSYRDPFIPNYVDPVPYTPRPVAKAEVEKETKSSWSSSYESSSLSSSDSSSSSSSDYSSSSDSFSGGGGDFGGGGGDSSW